MLSKADQKKIQALQQKKLRDREGLCIVEGVKGVDEVLKSSFEVVLVVMQGSLLNESAHTEVMKKAQKKGVLVEVVKDKEFSSLSSLTTPAGVLAVVRQKNNDIHISEGRYLIIDGVQDPGNMGTILRTADWFGITAVFLGKGCVDVYNPKVIQATMGSLFRIKFMQDLDIPVVVEEMRKHKVPTIASVLRSNTQELPHSLDSFALLIGSESHGVSKNILSQVTYTYTIPGNGGAESLNVSVATGILLYELTK